MLLDGGGEGDRSAPRRDSGETQCSDLFDSLQHFAEIAQATGVILVVRRLSAREAETLLAHEARHRGVPVLELAREIVVDPASAASLGAAECSVCGGAGVLRVFGDAGQVRVLTCPQGHGVIRKAWPAR